MKKVIVIGGGLGGLSAAISMRQKGYEVEIHEQNNHLGGKLNRLDQDGFGFDLGPSILTMPHIFEELFSKSGKQLQDYIAIEELSPQWKSFFPNGNTINLYNDLSKLSSQNPNLNAKDIEEYQDLLSYARNLYSSTQEAYFNKDVDTLYDIVKKHGIINSLKNFDVFNTVHSSITKYISNPEFRDMLSYIVKYVGSSPYNAPAVLNMMIFMQFQQGIFYVKGGMHKLAEAIASLAAEIGVKIVLNSKIDYLDKHNGNITAAHLSNGQKIQADYFISNMEVIPMYKKLLNFDHLQLNKMSKKFEPASSGLVLHIGVKGHYPQLAHHNFFFPENLKEQMNLIFNEHKLPEDPVIYLVNVNKSDSSQSISGHENLKILPHVPYLNGDNYSLADYEQFIEKVLIKLENMGLTNLRENIVTRDFWTPYDIERVYSSDRGAIYGTVSDKSKNKGFKHPKKSDFYNNLYFVGGTVNPGPGMPMVTLSGQLVANMISESERSN